MTPRRRAAVVLTAIVGATTTIFRPVAPARAATHAATGTTVTPPNTTAVRATPPIVGDHWHVAYGIYACNRYLPAIVSDNDPVGIHTHGDGVIHVHPFPSSMTGLSETTGTKAVLGVFLEVVGMKLSLSAMALPDGGQQFSAGGRCGTKPATVHVFSYKSASDRKPVELLGNPARIRFHNRQILSFAFVPEGVVPPAPPSAAELDDLSDVVPPPLTKAELAAMPAIGPLPTIRFPATATGKLALRDLVVGTGPVATPGTLPYIRTVAGLLTTKETLDPIGWGASGPTPLGTLGKKRTIAGLEEGIIGMRVGGRREIIVPPALAFGAEGNGGAIGPNETLVFIVDLLAVKKAGAPSSATPAS